MSTASRWAVILFPNALWGIGRAHDAEVDERLRKMS